MGIYSGKNSSNNSVRTGLSGAAAGINKETHILNMIKGYETAPDISDVGVLLSIDSIGAAGINDREQAALIKFYNDILPMFEKEITELNDGIPDVIKNASGSFIDFAQAGIFSGADGHEEFTYREMMQQTETTYAANKKLANLEEPYISARDGKKLLQQQENLEKRLLSSQEQMRDVTSEIFGELVPLLKTAFPGIEVEEDGTINTSAIDVSGIYLSPVALENINSLFKKYNSTISSLPYIKQYYSHRGLDEYKNDILGTPRFSLNAARTEAFADAINSNSDSAVRFLGGLNGVLNEMGRDKKRAERFIAGERFWPNDDAGGLYSNGINGGQTAIHIPSALKMAAIHANEELEKEYKGYSWTQGEELLKRHPQEVAKQLAGLLLHEYAHRVSQQQTRDQIEEKCDFKFTQVADIYQKVKSLGNQRASSLLHDTLGGYALTSPSEFYAEAFKYLHLDKENLDEYRNKFRRGGMTAEFDLLLKTIGM